MCCARHSLLRLGDIITYIIIIITILLLYYPRRTSASLVVLLHPSIPTLRYFSPISNSHVCYVIIYIHHVHVTGNRSEGSQTASSSINISVPWVLGQSNWTVFPVTGLVSGFCWIVNLAYLKVYVSYIRIFIHRIIKVLLLLNHYQSKQNNSCHKNEHNCRKPSNRMPKYLKLNTVIVLNKNSVTLYILKLSSFNIVTHTHIIYKILWSGEIPYNTRTSVVIQFVVWNFKLILAVRNRNMCSCIEFSDSWGWIASESCIIYRVFQEE